MSNYSFGRHSLPRSLRADPSVGVGNDGSSTDPRRRTLTKKALGIQVVVSCLVLGGAVGVVGAIGNGVASAADKKVRLATDTFARTVAGGWGSANAGGAWVTTPANAFSVAGGAGMLHLHAGKGVYAKLSVKTTDVDLRATLSVNKVGTAGGVYVSMVARQPSAGNEYYAKIIFAATGRVSLQLTRRVAWAETRISTDTAIPGKFAAGGALRVIVAAIGSNPTTIKAKIWRATVSQPTGWLVVARDSTAALQRPGVFGVDGYLSGAAKNAPVTVFVRGLTATRPTSAGNSGSSTPTPAPKPKPTVPVVVGPLAGARAADSAGSMAVGAAAYAVPADAIFVSPGGNDSSPGSAASPVATVQRAIALAPAGGTVVLRAGSYHQSVLVAKKVTIEGYPGEAAWFDGSRAVSGFVNDGGAWRADGWSAVFDHSPTYSKGAPDGTSAGWQFVNPNHPMAAYPDQVWFGSTALSQVGSRSALTAGTFYVDTAARALYVGSNPAGQQVRASDLQVALNVTGTGSVLRGFGVRRYATSVWQMGTVRLSGAGSTLENVVVQDNATQGIFIGAANVTLRHVTSTGNGLDGVQGDYANGLQVVGLRASGNNTQHFNISPVSAGVKLTRSQGISIVDSVADSNDGQGFWLDESVYNARLIGDDSRGNSGEGMRIELSQNIVVANNVVSHNSLGGVHFANAGVAQVWNNSFTRNGRDVNITQDSRRQSDPDMLWLSANIVIRNNIFDNSTGNALLAVEDWTHTYTAKALNVTADGNKYLRNSADAPSWAVVWADGAGNPRVYSSIALFSAATGQEAHTTAQSLPSAIASSVGQAVNAPHMGAW